MPKIFQLRTAADGIRPERAMLSASGKATAPVTMSPRPAKYGKGPLRRPVAANSKNSTPNTRSELRPINSGVGMPSNAARAARPERENTDCQQWHREQHPYQRQRVRRERQLPGRPEPAGEADPGTSDGRQAQPTDKGAAQGMGESHEIDRHSAHADDGSNEIQHDDSPISSTPQNSPDVFNVYACTSTKLDAQMAAYCDRLSSTSVDSQP